MVDQHVIRQSKLKDISWEIKCQSAHLNFSVQQTSIEKDEQFEAAVSKQTTCIHTKRYHYKL